MQQKTATHNSTTITLSGAGTAYIDGRGHTYQILRNIARRYTDCPPEQGRVMDALRQVAAAAVAGKPGDCPAPANEQERKAFAMVWDKARELASGRVRLLGTDILVFSQRYAVAGCVPLAFRSTEKDKIIIIDWEAHECPVSDDPPLWPIEALSGQKNATEAIHGALLARVMRDEGYVKPETAIDIQVHSPLTDSFTRRSYEMEALHVLLAHVTDIPF